MDDSNDFEDPFSYIPLKRKRRHSSKSQITQKSTTRTSQKKTPAKNSKTNKKTPKSSKIGNNGRRHMSQSRLTQTSPIKQLSMDLFTNKENNNQSLKGHCPMCQMPLRLLGDLNPETHFASCSETSRPAADECPLGISCNSLSKQHYLHYRHDELARHRDLGFLDLPTEIIETEKDRETSKIHNQSHITETPHRFPTPRRLTSTQPAAAEPRSDLESDICIDLTKDDGEPGRFTRSGRRPAPNLDITEPNIQEEIDPPLTNSTPARRKRVISPIQPCNTKNLTRITENETPESEDHPRLSNSHVNQFLNRIDHVTDQEEESYSLLAAAGQRPETSGKSDGQTRVPEGENDQFDDDDDNEDIFDDALDHIMNQACDEISSSVRAQKDVRSDSPDGATTKPSSQSTATSQQAGPSGGIRRQEKTPNNKDSQGRSSGRSNGRISEVQTLCTESPFQVRAVKDSEELELSLDLNSDVKCKSLKVRVPLRNGKVPVEVTARYSDASSPSKQAKITSYFGLNKSSEKKNDSIQSLEVSEYEPDSSEVLMVKKKDVLKVKEQWNKIFGLKPKETGADSRREKGVYVNRSQDRPGEEPKRKVPFYKKISGTSFAVDAFNYGTIPGVMYYFLSHYHYDHYGGLSRHWSKPIICSNLTKRMIVQFLKVNEKLVTTLDPGETRVWDNVEVSCVDANHCPGSVMFVFRLTTGKTILHTGDFRASPEMESDPVFWNYRNIDTVYLDTTYCKPEYDFPPQHQVIEHAILQVEEIMSKYNRVAVIVGAYTIGKERIFKGVAEHLDCKVWANNQRVRTWKALEDPDISRRMTYDRSKAVVQVVNQKQLCWSGLENEFDQIKGSFDHILGIKPTGWTHSTGLDPDSSLSSIRTKTRRNISFLEVPYSEHSSYSEIKRFIQFLRIKTNRQIIPTVNLRDRSRMNAFFDEWIRENIKKGPDSQ